MFRNIIYIPQWIAENTQRQNLPLNTVLDLKQLMTFTSTDDIVGFVAFNNSIGSLLGTDINMTVGSGITDYWGRCGCPQIQEILTNTIYPNIQPDTGTNVLNRLMSNTSIFDTDYTESFEAVDLNIDCSAIVLKYGFFETMQNQHVKFKLIESILQVLYVYYPHNQIAQTAIGRTYLEMLT